MMYTSLAFLSREGRRSLDGNMRVTTMGKHKRTLAIALAAGLGLAASGAASAQGGMGPGMMGYGYHGMGPGMIQQLDPEQRERLRWGTGSTDDAQ
ncbi:hypothetical protein [Halomonas sp.]|uniref:hypothetical protein n=1 Tax=Halomonas sp. TaxID=1486246 RepID=UPI00260B0145|nr:hypothetical protein [Halomonas sp.]